LAYWQNPVDSKLQKIPSGKASSRKTETALTRQLKTDVQSSTSLRTIHGHSLLVELLFREGARPEPSTIMDHSRVLFEGSTPLCVAFSGGMYGVVKVLLKAGVNARIPVRLFRKIVHPVEMADLQGDHDMVRLVKGRWCW
jgi:hypothetical protein